MAQTDQRQKVWCTLPPILAKSRPLSQERDCLIVLFCVVENLNDLKRIIPQFQISWTLSCSLYASSNKTQNLIEGFDATHLDKFQQNTTCGHTDGTNFCDLVLGSCVKSANQIRACQTKKEFSSFACIGH